jgi:hypothetical protein
MKMQEEYPLSSKNALIACPSPSSVELNIIGSSHISVYMIST